MAGRRPEPPRLEPARAHVPWVRLLGNLGMAHVVAAGAWLLGDPAFRVDPASATVTGARFTDEAAIRAKTGLVGGVRPTLFILATRRMEEDLEQMPTVVRADVTRGANDLSILRQPRDGEAAAEDLLVTAGLYAAQQATQALGLRREAGRG